MKANNVEHRFWAEAMNTACHVINRVYIRSFTIATPYQIWKGKKPNVKYFKVFGCVCYVLCDRRAAQKLDDKSKEAMFLGYSSNSKAYRVYLKQSQKVIESYNVVFDDCASVKVVRDLTEEEDQSIQPTPGLTISPFREEVIKSQSASDEEAESEEPPT